MRKRSSYRPRGVNVSAHLVAMLGAAKMGMDDVIARASALRASVDAACRGMASRPDWAQVFDAVNMAEQWARSGLVDGLDEILRLQDFIVGALDRQDATKTKALKQDEREALQAFAADYAGILSAVTHREYFEAQRAVEQRVRRVLAGEKIGVGVRVVEAVQ